MKPLIVIIICFLFAACNKPDCLLLDTTQAQTYDSAAVAVINNLIANNNLPAIPNAPETWSRFAEWDNSSPKQLNYLDISSMKLTGSASFAGLATLIQLFCHRNNLTGLDITNCTSLTVVDCWDNKLSELKLATNTELIHLWCHTNNMTVLDVSNNTKLQNLNCGVNPLSELELNNCPILKELNCGSANITKLDVTNLTQLQHLDCSSNKLPELYVSNLTKLQYLDCNVNKLTELNVTGCIALQYLDVNANRLTNIDLSGMDNLTVFKSYVQSTELKMEEDGDGSYIGTILLNNPTFHPEMAMDISYSNGVIKVASQLFRTMAWCETGKPEFTLGVHLDFLYPQSN